MEIFNLKYDDLFEPSIRALQILGGSASVSEIEDSVISILDLSKEKINDIHKGSRTKLSYRLAWARNYLKKYGYIENSERGIWSLTHEGLNINIVDKEEIKKYVRKYEEENSNLYNEIAEDYSISEGDELKEIEWQEEIIKTLKSISPDGFERLCQRLLREIGFENVRVTGKSGDGGIDGHGVYKFGGVLSFHVVFQCKRYSGSVSSDKIRDFRGAFIGRADKGLMITTGVFTREAKKEAHRDGAPPVDLIDGLDLSEKLKELRLGVEVELKEVVSINKDWFNSI